MGLNQYVNCYCRSHLWSFAAAAPPLLRPGSCWLRSGCDCCSSPKFHSFIHSFSAQRISYSEDLLLRPTGLKGAKPFPAAPQAQPSLFVGLRWLLGSPMLKTHIYLLLLSPRGSSASELLKTLPAHLSQKPTHLVLTSNFQFTRYLSNNNKN